MFKTAPIKGVSVVVPIFSEQESLPELIRHTSDVCEKLSKDYGTLLVDDGSSDRSTQLMMDASQAPSSHVVSILLNHNYGQHSAIITGFSYVTGGLTITLNADLQNPPEEIPRLTATTDKGFNVVGTIHRNHQNSVFHEAASRMVNHLIQQTTDKAMGGYGCMLRAYRRRIVDTMLYCRERSTFIPILANIFARRTTKVLVHHTERELGDSKYSFMRLVNLMYDLVTCLTTTPLRMLGLLGNVIAATGSTLSVLLIVLCLTLGPQWAAERVFILFAVLFTFIGARFIGMGLLGGCISRIYNDVRVRPCYFIQHVIHPQTTQSTGENRA